MKSYKQKKLELFDEKFDKYIYTLVPREEDILIDTPTKLIKDFISQIIDDIENKKDDENVMFLMNDEFFKQLNEENSELSKKIQQQSYSQGVSDTKNEIKEWLEKQKGRYDIEGGDAIFLDDIIEYLSIN